MLGGNLRSVIGSLAAGMRTGAPRNAGILFYCFEGDDGRIREMFEVLLLIVEMHDRLSWGWRWRVRNRRVVLRLDGEYERRPFWHGIRERYDLHKSVAHRRNA